MSYIGKQLPRVAAGEKSHCNYCVLTPREVTGTEKKKCAVFLDMDETMTVRKNSREIKNTFSLLDAYNYPKEALRSRMAQGRHLNPQALENLKNLISWIENNNMDPWIVISSDWRKDGTTEEVCYYMFVDFSPVGRTPSTFHGDPEFKSEEQRFFTCRGEEISYWIETHRPDEYVIFDDSDEGISPLHRHHFIQVQELIQPHHIVQATKQIAQKSIPQSFAKPERELSHCRFCIMSEDAYQNDRCYIFLDILGVLSFWHKQSVFRNDFHKPSVDVLLHYIQTLASHNIDVKIIITGPERVHHTTSKLIEKISKLAPSLAPFIAGRTPSQEPCDPEMKDLDSPPKVCDWHYPNLSSKEEIQKSWNNNHGICFRVVNLNSDSTLNAPLRFLHLHQPIKKILPDIKRLNKETLRNRPVTFVNLNTLFKNGGSIEYNLHTLQGKIEMEALQGPRPAVVLYYTDAASQEGYVIEPWDHHNLLWHPIGQYVEGSLQLNCFHEKQDLSDWSKKAGIENYFFFN